VKRRRLWPSLVLALWAFGYSTAWSCAVCVGNPDDPQTIGMSKAILGMLVVTGGVLASFAGFFVMLIRRSRRLENAEVGPSDRLELESCKEEVML
jgi:hypothetical protein